MNFTPQDSQWSSRKLVIVALAIISFVFGAIMLIGEFELVSISQSENFRSHRDQMLPNSYLNLSMITGATIADKPEIVESSNNLIGLASEIDVAPSFSLDNVVLMIASSSRYSGEYIRERIIPAYRTWMSFFPNVFVIIEDTVEARFQMRHCALQDHPLFTSFKCVNEPTYFLTRSCTTSYYVADCKLDESINYLINSQSKVYDRMKFFLQSDDDVYWRPDQVLRWLSLLDAANVTVPLIGNLHIAPNEDQRRRPGGIWHIDGCTEVKTQGWYQPMMLNKLALEKMKVATSSYGIMKTCKAFDVSQDVGLGVFAWLLELNHVHMPGVQPNGGVTRGFNILRSNQMVIHGVLHSSADDCEAQNYWPKDLRYNQHIMLGCGNKSVSSPYHMKNRTISMYDVWNWFAVNGTDVDIYEDWVNVSSSSLPSLSSLSTSSNSSSATILKPVISPLEGYNTTQHSQQHNLVTEWTTFNSSHCKIAGTTHVHVTSNKKVVVPVNKNPRRNGRGTN